MMWTHIHCECWDNPIPRPCFPTCLPESWQPRLCSLGSGSQSFSKGNLTRQEGGPTEWRDLRICKGLKMSPSLEVLSMETIKQDPWNGEPQAQYVTSHTFFPNKLLEYVLHQKDGVNQERSKPREIQHRSRMRGVPRWLWRRSQGQRQA